MRKIPAIGLMAFLFTGLPADARELVIHLPEPTWEFDAATDPLREREAGLPPGEEELAVQLRPLIAASDYTQAIAVLEQSDQSGFSPAMHFVLAQLYLAEGEFADAAGSYLATIALMPDFQRAHRGLGVVYMQLGETGKAREHLGRALSLGANDAQIYGQLAYLNLQDDKAYSAVSGFRQALFFEPDNRQWQQGLLQALIRSGDYQPASSLLREMLGLYPDDAVLWLQYSNIALRTDDEVAALSGLELAIRLGENHPDNLSLAGQLHLQAGNRERGVSLLETALEGSADIYPSLAGVVDWLLQSGHISDAKRLTAMAEEKSDSLTEMQQSTLLTQLARVDLAEGNQAAATTRLEAALDLDPANGHALMGLAQSQESANPALAESLYSRAQALPDLRDAALLAHARLAVSRKDHALALDLLEQAARDNPERGDISRNISILQRLVSQQADSNAL